MPRSTYYDKHYKMTSAMIRARQQYLVKNIFTGAALAVFVLGVCTLLAYSLTSSTETWLTSARRYRCIYNPCRGSGRFLRPADAGSATPTYCTYAECQGRKGD